MPEIRIADLDRCNIDDLISVCSPLEPDDPHLAQGVGIRRRWLGTMLSDYGSVAKIAYLNDEPVAQLMFYPEIADPSVEGARDGVVCLHCVYNPNPATQRKGIGRMLMKDFIGRCRARTGVCKGCKLVVAEAFDTGEGLALSKFHRKFGFKEAGGPTLWGGTSMHLHLVNGGVPELPRRAFVPLEEDKGRAVIFYTPTCQFSYRFASRAAAKISEFEQGIVVTLIDRWKQPEEYLKRGTCWAVVNSCNIVSGPADKQAFEQEVKAALAKR